MTYAQRLRKAYQQELRERKSRNSQNNVDYGINRKVPAHKDLDVPDYKTKAYETMHERLQRYAVKLYGLERSKW